MLDADIEEKLRRDGASSRKAGNHLDKCPPFVIAEMADMWRKGWISDAKKEIVFHRRHGDDDVANELERDLVRQLVLNGLVSLR